ncbi:MAG: hypothetical protein ACK5RL_06580 [Acidimicrobiales bacterium]
MPIPPQLTAAHLRVGVVPLLAEATDDDGHRRAVVAAVDGHLDRLDRHRVLIDAWRNRLGRIPRPPAGPQTLQELVSAARARLGDDRVEVETIEVVNRRFVLDHVRSALP